MSRDLSDAEREARDEAALAHACSRGVECLAFIDGWNAAAEFHRGVGARQERERIVEWLREFVADTGHLIADAIEREFGTPLEASS